MTRTHGSPYQHVEWSLLMNALVEIRQDGHIIRTGFVDNAMPDSSALWIAADAESPRQIFEASEGHQVWVTPQELTDDLRFRMTRNEIIKTKAAAKSS